MTRTATVRIGRVKLKGGADLRILRSGADAHRADVHRSVNRDLDSLAAAGSCIAGYAFVVWADDCASIASINTYSGMPCILAPDFVRHRLMAELIVQWAKG